MLDPWFRERVRRHVCYQQDRAEWVGDDDMEDEGPRLPGHSSPFPVKRELADCGKRDWWDMSTVWRVRFAATLDTTVQPWEAQKPKPYTLWLFGRATAAPEDMCVSGRSKSGYVFVYGRDFARVEADMAALSGDREVQNQHGTLNHDVWV